MSEATDALTEGLADAVTQHGQTFTVDGEVGTFTGVIEDTTETLGLSVGGMDATGEITITIPRETWTPTQQAIVVFDGEEYTVDRINGKIPTQWKISAVLRNT